MSELAWLLLLLPVAAGGGWLAGRRGGERKGGARVSRVTPARASASELATDGNGRRLHQPHTARM